MYSNYCTKIFETIEQLGSSLPTTYKLNRNNQGELKNWNNDFYSNKIYLQITTYSICMLHSIVLL